MTRWKNFLGLQKISCFFFKNWDDCLQFFCWGSENIREQSFQSEVEDRVFIPSVFWWKITAWKKKQLVENKRLSTLSLNGLDLNIFRLFPWCLSWNKAKWNCVSQGLFFFAGKERSVSNKASQSVTVSFSASLSHCYNFVLLQFMACFWDCNLTKDIRCVVIHFGKESFYRRSKKHGRSPCFWFFFECNSNWSWRKLNFVLGNPLRRYQNRNSSVLHLNFAQKQAQVWSFSYHTKDSLSYWFPGRYKRCSLQIKPTNNQDSFIVLFGARWCSVTRTTVKKESHQWIRQETHHATKRLLCFQVNTLQFRCECVGKVFLRRSDLNTRNSDPVQSWIPPSRQAEFQFRKTGSCQPRLSPGRHVRAENLWDAPYLAVCLL